MGVSGGRHAELCYDAKSCTTEKLIKTVVRIGATWGRARRIIIGHA